MKKYLFVVFFLVVVVIMVPNISLAATFEEIQAQINALLAQIKALQAQQQQIQPSQQWCHDFSVNSSIGNHGENVQALQVALYKEGFFKNGWSYDNLTLYNWEGFGNFDEETAAAVSGFQQKYASEILTPIGLKYGTGFVGKATRTKLKSLYGCGIIQPAPTPVPIPVPTTPSITVLSPNGGEKWIIGQYYNIQWNSKNNSSGKVDIILRRPNGFAYDIASQTADTLSLVWLIPSNIVPANDYTIEINTVCSSLPCQYTPSINQDTSNAPFSIVAATSTPSITVLSPNGGEKWEIGKTYSLKWSTTALTSKKVNINLFKNKLFIREIFHGASQSSDAGLFDTLWVIPNNLPLGDGYKIQIIDATNGLIDDLSDAVFSIVATSTIQPSITVLSPNGGEKWEIGKTYNIQYKNTTGKDVSIELMKGNNLMGLLTYSLYPSQTSHSVTVPAQWQIGSDYKIRIKVDNIVDTSDAPFSIVAATSAIPTITTITTFVYESGSGEITIEGTNLSQVVKLLYTNTANNYSGELSSAKIKSISSTQVVFYSDLYLANMFGNYKIKVVDSQGIASNEMSINWQPASTISSITVLSPNGGEAWGIGSTQTIRWNSQNLGTSTVNINLQKNDIYLRNLFYKIVNDGSENWTIPSDLILTNGYKIVVIKADESTIYDKSDASFSITAAGSGSIDSINQMADILESAKTTLIQMSEFLKSR